MAEPPRNGPAPVASPCRRLCTLDDDDVCVGCGRTITEICGWSALDEAGKRRVVEAANARLEEYRRRYPRSYR
jgi:hypothetical protein